MPPRQLTVAELAAVNRRYLNCDAIYFLTAQVQWRLGRLERGEITRSEFDEWLGQTLASRLSSWREEVENFGECDDPDDYGEVSEIQARINIIVRFAWDMGVALR